MIALWIILGLLLILLSGILFSPFYLTIDTVDQRYSIRIGGVGIAQLIPAWDTDDLVYIRWRLWFWQREYHPIRALLDGKKQKSPTRRGKQTSRRSKRRSRGRMIRSMPRVQRVLRSFRIHDFQLDLDLHDPVWNAWLVPVAAYLDRGRGRLSINFIQRNALRLKVSNRLIHVLRAWIFS